MQIEIFVWNLQNVAKLQKFLDRGSNMLNQKANLKKLNFKTDSKSNDIHTDRKHMIK